MVRGRKVCKFSVRQCNEIRMLDRESTIIRNSKCKLKQAFSTIDTNSTRKKVFQTSHSVAKVVLVLAIYILHGGYLFKSTQVSQISAFYGGEDGPAKVRGSPSLYTGDGGIGGARGSTTLEGFSKSGVGINNWNNII